ncbi:uncharacterized protein LOC110929037 isoform X1 [Helianthus annuus]|uniref:uncharacterized protein LOC110929037 isoform X1 n=1 Tax=Helianthus annuus TaxID=4232 RepID=UPI000B902199|nr:uncharacterized protein LOC110929037 isoform X1 [Helianthus annuus]
MESTTITKFAHLQIPLEDVQKATNNFHDDNIIGHGDFGRAYEGVLLRSDKLMKIAARRLDRKRGLGDVEFWKEVSVLSDLKHPNLVSIIGFCDERNEKIVVTTYEANGSLGQFLDSPNLTWTQRLRICVGVAQSLSYLHSAEGRDYIVIHRFINSSTILLDENWEAKLSGFEISMKQSVNRMDQALLSEPIGAMGYMDPTIGKTRGVTHKSDVYSFGVVLFEILCGRKAYIENEAYRFLASLVKCHHENNTLGAIVHPYLANDQMSLKSLNIYLRVALSCLEEEAAHRPDMDYIVVELKKALEAQMQRDNLEDGVQRPDIDQAANENIPEEQVEHSSLQHIIDQFKDICQDLPKPEISWEKLEHLKIGLNDVKLATHDFAMECMISSSGHYTLYRAALSHFDEENPNIGAIKRISSGQDIYGKEEFHREIEMLTTIKHHAIATLLGYFAEGSEMVLLINNVDNGLLSSYLGNENAHCSLTWEKRLKICIDVAHALNYLHSEIEDQKRIINRYISSSSIGLDENWGAKIIEFGFSIFLPPNHDDKGLYHGKPCGAEYFADPEYLRTGYLTRKSDVYSFGVVLLEMLCGRPAHDIIYFMDGHKGLAYVARQCFRMGTLENMIDPTIKEETSENNFVLNKGPNKDSLHTFMEIAYYCVDEVEHYRPTMKEVVEELEKALLLQKNNKDNPRISLEDIRLATQNFHVDNYIGRGGFGKVYKGNCQYGDRVEPVVAKQLDKQSDQGEQQFLSELQILMEYKHENVIGLVGYCDEQGEKVIVYEYASRRSLDRYLNAPYLTWMQRLNICIEVASALDFLHRGVGKQSKVVHRDIKTENILLNHDWKAKLGDFGLSLISPKSDYIIDSVCGTLGYLDPVYKKLQFLSIESDIYSFGVVLFEILCGRSTFVIHKHEGHYLPDFIKNKFEERKHDEVVFEPIKKQIEPRSLNTFQKIAYQCLRHERAQRPTAKEVLIQLKKALEFQNMASIITMLAHLQIPLEHLIEATNNFHDDNIIRHSRFGPSYKGQLMRSGKLINIVARRLDCKHGLGDFEFLTEVSLLSDLKHTNLVTIVGFCEEKEEKIIVTTYEANGSLSNHLSNPNLTWKQRLRICLGVARALSYLHYDEGRGYGVINRIISSDTILLDENWEAKLSCFEYSIKQFHKDQVCICEPIGVTGYMESAIEKTGGLTHRSDIYSFGVVLSEIFSGRKAYIENEANRFLAPWAKYHFEMYNTEDIILPGLQDQMSHSSLMRYSRVVCHCLNEETTFHPDIDYVIATLEGALEIS